MINIPIDEYASILQPYFDGSDTYVDNFKHSLVGRYKTNPEGCMKQSWDSICVDVLPNSVSVAEIDGLNIDISDFDRFRIFGLIPSSIHVKLYCNDELVLDEDALGVVSYIDGQIKTTQKIVNKLRYEFINNASDKATASLHYLGMISDKPRNKNPYTDEWEGYFDENPDYGLFNNNYINEEELEKIREKIKREPYKKIYEEARKRAFEAMNRAPEELIGRSIQYHHRVAFRITDMGELAIVGQIEKNPEMLRMACRCALSTGCCQYWGCDDMETASMITWHHRSFTEARTVQNVSIVLSLAGGLLSWHGRNFLYNMIIMKGFPRIEADFMTMDYIYKCNQGIVFMSGYIQGLLAVVHQFPRYKPRIEEAKKILAEMCAKTFEPDGSYSEGPIYWNFTLRRYLNIMYLLAKYENKSLREMVGDFLDKTSNYGIAMLNEKGTFLSFADGNEVSQYSIEVAALLYELTKNEQWASVLPKTECLEIIDFLLASSVDVPESDKPFLNEFTYFPNMGLVQTYRDGVLFASLSGPSNNTHSHCDKGGFIIHKNGNIVVPDVNDRYDKAGATNLYKTEFHSLAMPIVDGKYISQYKGEGYVSHVTKAQLENNIFEFCVDNDEMWDSDVVIGSKRYVYSEKSNEFIITDEFEFSTPSEVEFRINFRDENALSVEPIDWTPVSEEVCQIYHTILGGTAEDLRKSGGQKAENGFKTYQRRLKSEKALKVTLKTKIIIL